MQYYKIYNSPIGELVMVSDENYLCGLYFKGQKNTPANLCQVKSENCPSVFTVTENWLNIYFAGNIPTFTPPIKFVNATQFELKVWQELTKIPYGKTVNYGAIATLIASNAGKNPCAQAVGRAVGKNPIGIIIPCHRVIGKNGSLTGYAGGLDKKTALLKIEKILP